MHSTNQQLKVKLIHADEVKKPRQPSSKAEPIKGDEAVLPGEGKEVK